ncbi:hypothetical protein B6R96_15720 [Streptomyces sp. Sge12]|nr:hypothetical protein B6R96_15720 [Streptomyces sp. Sge12]
MRVSGPGDRFEREAEANASRVMTGAAPVQRAARDEHGTHGTHHPHGPGAVALKGPEGRDQFKPYLALRQLVSCVPGLTVPGTVETKACGCAGNTRSILRSADFRTPGQGPSLPWRTT